MKVFINPGHGTDDPGACGFGLKEAEVAAKIGAILERKLNAAGIETKNLQTDEFGSIPVIANEWGADLFVSIHCNAANAVARGTEVLVYRFNSQGATLGEKVQESIVARLGTVDRGLKERPGLYVLRATDMPSILIETAFIDEARDNALLASRQEDFADAISVGILAYAGINALSDIASTRKIAPNGEPYDQNDIDYLLGEGYTLADALSFLDTTDKYSNSDMKAAAEYAESRVGSTGYGNNGCTEWVRRFLLKANHPFGQLMTDGSQGNLMWVPNIMSYAKEHGLWKEAEEGGAMGDICLLETNYCKADGPDHVVVACGDGNYWGNSSSRNKIVKSSIAGDYGADNVYGYVATGSGAGKAVSGKCNRSAAEIVGDAGSTSCVNLAPNGMVYEENDIQYLVGEGYTVDDAIIELSKSPKYNSAPARIAPNGKPYEQNDIDYLVKKCGYTLDAAISELSMADKYIK
ncbi:MAG: N-acetylmuramoyl-L-alanine amidase [Selenomonadaceae bacterium]|nr:N-acetylmuramoyl-L-alanine amidase [Selenomonadaceae bacterium]